MTSLTRNLPWFVRDLGVGTIGEVRFLGVLLPFLVLGAHFTGLVDMLRFSCRESECGRRAMPQTLAF